MSWFYPLSIVSAVAMLPIFIQGIRLCCQVEARSEDLTGVPQKAAMFEVVTNRSVARPIPGR